jgi:hypothetical protein
VGALLGQPFLQGFPPKSFATKMHKKKEGWMAKKCLDKAGREDALHGKSERAGSQPVL